ncbi:signal peptidase I [Enterococcus avium]|uniref:Signal peptidase I n=1 Tax=Enterococcus avium TaxID=33945 RepID=A0AAW8S1R4_ENTAV|nr:signal peptidase I [Enterococcus avium]MDT2404391.1 signal peptidase I [Enterococcus avium]
MNKIIKEWLPVVIIIALIFLARMFVFSPVKVEGHSMDPTLHDKQRLVTSKISNLDRQDIITTKEPDNQNMYVVKRIIGLPGDHVQMKNNVLTINGKEYAEPYLDEFKKKSKKDKLNEEYSYNTAFQEQAANADRFTNDFEVTVPKNRYFVLGDNRLISKDSRIFGFVDKSLIQGKVVVRFWPLNEIKLF